MDEEMYLVEYEVIVKGHLDQEHWINWFEEAVVALEQSGTTVLRATMDQTALYGMLGKIRDLGLTLMAVNRKKF